MNVIVLIYQFDTLYWCWLVRSEGTKKNEQSRAAPPKGTFKTAGTSLGLDDKHANQKEVRLLKLHMRVNAIPVPLSWTSSFQTHICPL